MIFQQMMAFAGRTISILTAWYLGRYIARKINVLWNRKKREYDHKLAIKEDETQ